MKKHMLMVAACAVLGGSGAGALAANGCSAHSPAHRVALIELFTSEGCDSCPPADQYLGGLRAAGVTPDSAVLLALHVDYWDYIGWKDPFARAAFTERQRWLSGLANSRTIYTPEIFVAGQELRGGVAGWGASLPAQLKRINARAAGAQIGIALGAIGASGVPIDVTASAPVGATLHVALVENGLVSMVTAGENRGHALRHDAVARGWLAPLPLVGAGNSGTGAARLAQVLALPPGALAANLAVSAFVQSASGDVLQAFSLPLCVAR